MKINTLYLYLFIAGLSFFLVSCEDPIDISLDEGKSQLAVDGLLLLEDGPQQIRLTLTGKYFDNNSQAAPATGAKVTVGTLSGQVFNFSEDPLNPGIYRSSESLPAKTGEFYGILIEYQGQRFGAFSQVRRRMVIDTLNQEERPSEFGNEAGSYLNLVVRDSAGIGDFCWIRYNLNGKEDLRPGRLNQALPVDGAFNPGAADGLEFIYPIQNSINGDKGYLVGDTITVSLLTIDPDQWRFLKEMDIQLNNVGLFANPIANVRGNIQNLDSTSTVKAVGHFGVAQVSRAGVRIKEPVK